MGKWILVLQREFIGGEYSEPHFDYQECSYFEYRDAPTHYPCEPDTEDHETIEMYKEVELGRILPALADLQIDGLQSDLVVLLKAAFEFGQEYAKRELSGETHKPKLRYKHVIGGRATSEHKQKLLEEFPD